MERIEQAKQIRNIYWYIPAKDSATKDHHGRTRDRHSRIDTARTRLVLIPETPNQQLPPPVVDIVDTPADLSA
jgi:hypothetical protein